MCGSLLSKFNRKRNKVNPVESTESLKSVRVREKTKLSYDKLSVEESTTGGKIRLVREEDARFSLPYLSRDILEVEPCKIFKEVTKKDDTIFFSAANREGNQTDSYSESLFGCKLDSGLIPLETEKYSLSAIECYKADSLAEQGCGRVTVCKTTTEQEEIQRDQFFESTAAEHELSAKLEQEETEADSRSMIECDSAPGHDERKTGQVCEPATACSSSADNEDKTTEPDIDSKRNDETASGSQRKPNEPETAPGVEWNSCHGLEEKNSGRTCGSEKLSTSGADCEETKAEQDLGSASVCQFAANLEHNQEVPDSWCMVECDSASGFEWYTSEQDCKSVTVHDAVADYEETLPKREFDPLSQFETASGLREVEINPELGSEIEFDSSADHEENRIETDVDALPACEPAAFVETKQAGLSFGSIIECDSTAVVQENKSELVCRSVTVCKSNVGHKDKRGESELGSVSDCDRKRPEPDSATIECDSVVGFEEMKKTKPEFGSVSECKSSVSLKQKKTEIDTGCEVECSSEVGSEEKTIGPFCTTVREEGVNFEETKAAPESKPGADCQSSVEISQEETKLDSNSVTAFGSAPDLHPTKIELNSTSGVTYQSAANAKIKTEPEVISAPRCKSKVELQVTQGVVNKTTAEHPNNDSFPSTDEDVNSVKALLQKRKEKHTARQDDANSSDESSGSSGVTVKQPAVVPSRRCSGPLAQQLTECRRQVASNQVSPSTKEYEEELCANQGSPGCSTAASRQPIIDEEVRIKTCQEVATSHTVLQSPTDSAVIPGNQENLLAIAERELEEHVMKVRNLQM